MKNKNDKNKIRQPMVNPGSIEGQPQQPVSEPMPGTETEAEVSITESGESYISEPAPEAAPDIKGAVSSQRGPSGTLDELSQIDPDLLSGKTGPDVEPDSDTKLPAKSGHGKEGEKNEIAEVALNLGPEEAKPEEGKKRRKTGLAFVVIGAIIVLAVLGLSYLFDTGLDQQLISPLTINGRDIPSDEFSFMYHYELLQEGVDIFAPGTAQMLASPYPDDENFPTYRDYFLDRAADDLQKMEILYDDAVSKGYSIENAHFERANAYINWLSENAKELGVPLDTYIKGVFGNQVDEQCIINTLAKKYFTDDYANGEKLVELSATDEQAEQAYNEARNEYDLVSYKILRITYEQRDQAFIDTANIHAQEIIDKMAGDPSTFESVASGYFSGVAANTLSQPDSTLIPDQRYGDITHSEFRDWLFDLERVPGDATIIPDEDGFPIILVFVERNKMQTPLRNVFIYTINPQYIDETGPDISGSQSLAQEIYDYIDSPDACNQIENLYNDYVLSGTLSVRHNEMTYLYEYNSFLNDWIFDESRQLGDKTIIEDNGTFYVLYFVSVSENPEWYDRVNSFLRMNNYQAFLTAKQAEYAVEFNPDGLAQISDVP
ncbi:MAG: hypothetical protein IK128_02350 [Clostridiales bacterium]|nr:hypothetical protein [Clostridiales bacterium]